MTPRSGGSQSEKSSDEPDIPASQLDDEADREELRQRYYGLVQELRVLLPGVQVLAAFLLTAPFATGFERVDSFGRDIYGVALVSSILAVVAFMSPTAFHRFGERRHRSERLQIGILMTRVGFVLLALALVCSLVVVSRVVFSGLTAALLATVVVVAMAVTWLVIPLRSRVTG